MCTARVLTILAAVVLVGASVSADQVVYQEDFSLPFVHHDWVYNNSGNNNADGYPGGQPTQRWPCMISADGQQLLGYEPSIYYATSFEPPDYPQGPISGVQGWSGAGEIVGTGHGLAQSLRFYNQTAYRNVATENQLNVQYVQLYAKCSETTSTAYIYVGTTDMADVAAIVRFNSDAHIEALDGDGGGGGVWVPVALYQIGRWYRITIKLDYAAGAYRVAVAGAYNSADLGFRDPLAIAGLRAIKFEQTGGGTELFVDDLCASNTPYPPGSNGDPYWFQTFNHWSLNYGVPMDISTYDTYDWMSCYDLFGNPVNTDPTRAACYQASLPEGWTAAFGMQFDIEPQNYWGSGRGKMGFTRLMGAYAQSPDNPCLHVWASHGDLRIASPNISAGPGVYRLDFRAGVWNCNTADPALQDRWTDFCSWGYGYSNWCVWDPYDPLHDPPYIPTIPPYSRDYLGVGIIDHWVWPFSPFQMVDPYGVIDNRPDGPHPPGEEPGMWHSFSREFAFGNPPVKDDSLDGSPTDPDLFQSEPGWFIGFRVSHGHDPWNAGYQWATILNVDDIVLTKKSPLSCAEAKNAPVGTLVEVADLVIVNMIPPDPTAGRTFVDVHLEARDRSGGIMVRFPWSYNDISVYNYSLKEFVYTLGEVVSAVGAISKDAKEPPFDAMTDTKHPVKYITSSGESNARLPALVRTQQSAALKPVGVNGRSLIGQPVTAGLANDSMLVTVVGRVNNIFGFYEFPWYYVDDGSGLDAGETEWGSGVNGVGVKIDCTALTLDPDWSSFDIPADGSYVAVTGAVTAQLHWDGVTVTRVVYPRDHNDIVVMPE